MVSTLAQTAETLSEQIQVYKDSLVLFTERPMAFSDSDFIALLLVRDGIRAELDRGKSFSPDVVDEFLPGSAGVPVRAGQSLGYQSVEAGFEEECQAVQSSKGIAKSLW